MLYDNFGLFMHEDYYIYYLQSSSIIFTVALPGLPTLTISGNDPGTIIISKFLLPSKMLSGYNKTLQAS